MVIIKFKKKTWESLSHPVKLKVLNWGQISILSIGTLLYISSGTKQHNYGENNFNYVLFEVTKKDADNKLWLLKLKETIMI